MVNEAKSAVGQGECRVKLQRELILFAGCVVALIINQGRTQPVIRIGEIRLQFDRLPVGFACIGVFALAEHDVAHAEIGIAVTGIQPAGGLEGFGGFRQALEIFECHTVCHQAVLVLRTAGDGTVDRSAEMPGTDPGIGQEHMCRCVMRFGGNRLLKPGNGMGPFPGQAAVNSHQP